MVVEAKNPGRNKALAAVLNSTLVAFIKPYFSRTVGTEAHTQLDVYAANILPVPNVQLLPMDTIGRLAKAFEELGNRPITHLVEQRLLKAQNLSELKDRRLEPREWPLELQREDRQTLDKEVLRAIGLPEAQTDPLLRKLYFEVTRLFNEGRFLELQANENKKRAKKGGMAGAREVAKEIFDSLDPAQIRRFPGDFLPDREPLDTIELPEGKAKLYDRGDFYDANALAIGKGKITLRHRAQAEVAKLYADLHLTGFIKLPVEKKVCERLRRDWESYSAEVLAIFQNLVTERTDDEELQEAIIAELNRLLLNPLQDKPSQAREVQV